ILLTGDLEGEGLRLLLNQKPTAVDVLMAPHHGSRRVEGADRLMAWAQPRVVVSCQRQPRTESLLPNPYEVSSNNEVNAYVTILLQNQPLAAVSCSSYFL